jgi:hypothetical protein
MKNIFNSDNYLVGIVLALVLAAISLGLVQLLVSSFEILPYWLAKPKVPWLLALIPNLILFRFYMVNKKLDKTGRGILLVTFAGLLAIFFLVN